MACCSSSRQPGCILMDAPARASIAFLTPLRMPAGPGGGSGRWGVGEWRVRATRVRQGCARPRQHRNFEAAAACSQMHAHTRSSAGQRSGSGSGRAHPTRSPRRSFPCQTRTAGRRSRPACGTQTAALAEQKVAQRFSSPAGAGRAAGAAMQRWARVGSAAAVAACTDLIKEKVQVAAAVAAAAEAGAAGSRQLRQQLPTRPCQSPAARPRAAGRGSRGRYRRGFSCH